MGPRHFSGTRVVLTEALEANARKRALESAPAVRGLDSSGIEAFLVLAIFQRSQEAELDTAETTLADLVAGSLPSEGASLGQDLLWRVGGRRATERLGTQGSTPKELKLCA